MKGVLVLTLLLSLLMLGAGFTHFWKTSGYLRLVPSFLPARLLIIQLSGALELLTGLGLLFPATRRYAAFCIVIMMIGFLPLHIWDLFRERPAVGSKTAAWIRFPMQFVLIAWSGYVWKQAPF
jgi:uncharacterized membrane protein